MRALPVSVVMSIDNVQAHLEWGLDQLLHMLRFDDELIVLDACNSGHTRATCHRLQSHYNNVRVVQADANRAVLIPFGAEQAINPVVLFLNENLQMTTHAWQAFLAVLQCNPQQGDRLWGCFEMQAHGGRLGLRLRAWWWGVWSRLTKRVRPEQAMFVSRALLIQYIQALALHPHRSHAMLSARLWFNVEARFVVVRQAVIISP